MANQSSPNIQRSLQNFRSANYDIISHLPSDVTQDILDRLTLKEAVKTSAVSRNWRYIWAQTKKSLIFHKHFMDQELSSCEYVSLAYHVLLQHKGCLNIFSLDMPDSFDHKIISSEPMRGMLFKCMELVCKKGVKELSVELNCWTDMCDYEVMTPLFYSSELTHLRLSHCELKVPSDFGGFPKLDAMDFSSVNFLDHSFENIVSRCTQLSLLRISWCTSPYDYCLCSDSLKHLKLAFSSVSRREAACKSIFDVSSKNLVTLDIIDHNLAGVPVRFGIKTFSSLRKFNFSCSRFSISCNIPFLLDLFDKALNLEELELSTDLISGVDPDEWNRVSLEEGGRKKIENLKFVNICMWNGSEDELLLVKLLLALSPSLNKVVVIQRYKNDKNSNVLGELKGFPRVSPNAQLKYLNYDLPFLC